MSGTRTWIMTELLVSWPDELCDAEFYRREAAAWRAVAAAWFRYGASMETIDGVSGQDWMLQSVMRRRVREHAALGRRGRIGRVPYTHEAAALAALILALECEDDAEALE